MREEEQQQAEVQERAVGKHPEGTEPRGEYAACGISRRGGEAAERLCARRRAWRQLSESASGVKNSSQIALEGAFLGSYTTVHRFVPVILKKSTVIYFYNALLPQSVTSLPLRPRWLSPTQQKRPPQRRRTLRLVLTLCNLVKSRRARLVSMFPSQRYVGSLPLRRVRRPHELEASCNRQYRAGARNLLDRPAFTLVARPVRYVSAHTSVLSQQHLSPGDLETEYCGHNAAPIFRSPTCEQTSMRLPPVK